MNWIFKLTFRNLFRRKIRTILTILGIAIGILSLVVLIGIGKGIENQILKEFDTGVNIKKIEVIGNSSNKYKCITDRRIEEFAEISNVENVYPVLEYGITVDIDKYMGFFMVKGIPKKELDKLELENGSLDKLSKVKPDLILGDYVGMLLFYNNGTKSFCTEADNKTKTLMGKKAKTTYIGDQEFSDSLKIAAVLKERETYSMDSMSVYCDLESLKRYCKKNSVNGKRLAQPVKVDGTPYQEWIYDKALVVVNDIENVDYVVKRLQDMGYETYNEKEELEMAKRIISVIKFMFACIGAIALFIAVIGISNTMTTAVYDRIGEIGMLKMLGCDLDELKLMFILEAGIISILGGIFGCIVSYGVNGIINKLITMVLKFPKGMRFVSLEPKTVILAIVFSLLLGMAAGFLPAGWAAKVKPLNAINKVD